MFKLRVHGKRGSRMPGKITLILGSTSTYTEGVSGIYAEIGFPFLPGRGEEVLVLYFRYDFKFLLD